MTNVGSGPDAQTTSVVVTAADEEVRPVPNWVYDEEESEKVWGAYNAHLRGAKVHQIAQTYDVSTRTIYKWLSLAREELPYHVIAKVGEMVDIRLQWVHMAWKLAEAMDKSTLRLDRKAEQLSKLMNASGAWLTAVEELTGARRGTGSRINVHTTGEGQTALIFDMDKLLEMQKPTADTRDPPADTRDG